MFYSLLPCVSCAGRARPMNIVDNKVNTNAWIKAINT